MNKIKKYFYFTLGMLSLGMAYIGVVTPGIPFSIFLVFAAFCFARSSKKMHDWLYNHKQFGPFLTNWGKYRIFPQKAKYLMAGMMTSSLLIMIYATGNMKAVMYAGISMLLVAIWAWRFPSTIEINKQRKKEGKTIGWFK